MADALVKHAFVSAIPEGSNPATIRTSNWNAALLFTGGSAGELLVRDTVSATGAAWAASSALTTLGAHITSAASLVTIGDGSNLSFYHDPTAGLSAFGQTGNTVAVVSINRNISDAAVKFGLNVLPTHSASGVEATGVRIAQSLAAAVTKTNGAGLVVEGPTMGAGASFGASGYFSGLFRGNHEAVAAGATFALGVTLALESSNSRTLWIASDLDPTTPASGIYFGASIDTNLYRSAAGQLTTDGKMRFTGAIGVIGSPNASAAIAIGSSSGIPSSGGLSRVIYNLATIPATSTTIAYGYTSEPLTAASAFTCVEFDHLQMSTITIGSGSAVTSQYGLKVAPLTTAANNYGAAIGKASTQTLWLSHAADDTTKEGGIAFGISRDTNLYRSAANVLKSDDALDAASFKVGGVAGVSFGPAHPASITIVNGIVTACS